MLHDAGIGMIIFTSHLTKSVLTNKAATKVPTETLLKTGGWRSMRMLENYYNKQIDNSEIFATGIVHCNMMNVIIIIL